MRSPMTWLLIADGGHARVLQTIGVGNALVPVDGMTLSKALPPSRELGTERPSRTHESMGATRHAMSPRTDAHRELKRSFAHAIAERLDAALQAGAFEHLVVVAPPVTLGDLRQAWSRRLADVVSAEVAKDLVKVPDKDLRAHLTDVVAI